MLGLRLREEFRGKRLRGTTVDFTNDNKTGALEVSASEFLRITYPSNDLLKTIESTGPGQSRPVVLLGSRGQGKSHLLAALYHLSTNGHEGRLWLDEWAARLHRSEIGTLSLRSDCCVIAESVHNHNYKFLWDILFDRHPEGQYGKGLWEAHGEKKTEVPGQKILLEMFKRRSTVLILDEFQTWYDGLTNTKQYPWRNWAFNFIQILSEIAQKSPELLVLVVSVREGNSDATQQIARVNPVLVDFQGLQARKDRRRLLLHRIFDNRMQVPEAKIRGVIHTHVQEFLRLAKISQPDHERYAEDFVESWPFAPHLLQLLDDQVLIAADAQETRDLIKILVDVYKQVGDDQPLITAADFSLTNEKSAVASLLDSVANPLHKDLRQKALRNLEAVQNAVTQAAKTLPHCESIINALWLRSLTLEKVAGADPADLQVDITRDRSIDDNAFEAELATIEGESFNIHRIGTRLVFKQDENLRTKLLTFAKNDKLFAEGQDIDHLAKEVRSVLSGPEHVSQGHRVVFLKRKWDSEPWAGFEEKDLPKNWDGRLPLIVIPQYPDKLEVALGDWLKHHLQEGRNTIRFLLPQKGNPNIYYDRELVVLARAVYLAMQWRREDINYGELERKFRGDLVGKLKGRFDRFAVLDVWNFGDAAKCSFHEQAHGAQGDKIPDKIDQIIRQDVFVPEEFEDYVLSLAENGESVGKLLRELREPRAGGNPSIPWLGEVPVKERLTRMCAAGEIAVNLRGMTMLQATPTETEDEAWNRMKGRIAAVTGKQLDEVTLHKPGSVAISGGKAGGTTTGNGSGLVGGTGGMTGKGTGTTDIGVGARTDLGTGGIGNLFGGSGGTATATPFSAAPTSGLNLLGQVVDNWGIGPATTVSNVNLRVGKMTGAQLRALLKHLPDGVTYGLGLEKE